MAVPFGTQTEVSVHLRVTFVLEFNKGSGERQEPIAVFYQGVHLIEVSIIKRELTLIGKCTSFILHYTAVAKFGSVRDMFCRYFTTFV